MDSYSAAVAVKVDLKLELINFPSKELIIPPMSSYRLKLNKPDSVTLKYGVVRTDDTAPVSVENGVLRSTHDGTSIIRIDDIIDGQTLYQKVTVIPPTFLILDGVSNEKVILYKQQLMSLVF